jgi:hypothetical protein
MRHALGWGCGALLLLGGCASGEKIAEAHFTRRGEAKTISMRLQRGDRLDLWETYKLRWRDVGKERVVYRSDRCYRWHLSLSGPRGAQSRVCWAHARSARCTSGAREPHSEKTDCRVEDCSFTATADGPTRLTARLERADDGCPNELDACTLIVRRVLAER